MGCPSFPCKLEMNKEAWREDTIKILSGGLSSTGTSICMRILLLDGIKIAFNNTTTWSLDATKWQSRSISMVGIRVLQHPTSSQTTRAWVRKPTDQWWQLWKLRNAESPMDRMYTMNVVAKVCHEKLTKAMERNNSKFRLIPSAELP